MALPPQSPSTQAGMDPEESAHSDKGLGGVLAIPWVYRVFGKSIGGTASRERLVRDYIKPFEGCRILDIGCGPGSLPAYLPNSIGEYCGVDVNPAYIDAARARWKSRPAFSFVCEGVGSGTTPRRNYYDIVTAVAIVHHLDDADARHLFAMAYEALVPGGRLVTWDGVYLKGQSRLARWLISRDRGRMVRTDAGYRHLAAEHFDLVTGEILHDTLRVPYTIFAMTCTKDQNA